MIKLKLLTATFFSVITISVSAQDYSVAFIPDSLKENAHIVIRDDQYEIILKSVNTGIEKVIRVITIFDRSGESMAALSVPYDKNTSVNVKQIIIYDANGKKIKNVKNSDINDSPASGSSELFSDSRIIYYKPTFPVPYTILYEYEVDLKNIISLGCWRPMDSYNLAIQLANLKFSYPSEFKINHKEINIHTKLSERHTNIIFKEWEVKNLKAIEQEPYDVNLSERLPAVYLMPSILSFDKYEGRSDTWEQYGKWLYSLYQGRDILSGEEKIKVDNLLKNLPDTLQKITALYKYLQENTRYVAITLGIGGFQPFDATTVFSTGYGDCKALSNYMYSLLKYCGIKSYPALVSSGRYKEPIFTDFPNFQQFDHVILCIPKPHDTIWLECTNQKIPFGFLGDFTDDRDVLLITENGGKFAHTKKYGANDNTRSTRAEFIIDSTGASICKIRTLYRGLQYDNISEILNSSQSDFKKWLYSISSLQSLQIQNFSAIDLKGKIPVALINISETSKNYCSLSGKYLLLPLNLLNSQSAARKMLKPRLSDILINRSSIDCDSIVFKIPENYVYESVPRGNTINSKFGSYSYSVSVKEKEITYIRRYSINEGRYKPDNYKELYDFILSVSKADNLKVILKQKDLTIIN